MVLICYNLQNNPTFHHRKGFSQLSKKKRVLCWSFYIISLEICNVVFYLPRAARRELERLSAV